MGVLNEGKSLRGDLGWAGGGLADHFLSDWGLLQLTQNCLILFCGLELCRDCIEGKCSEVQQPERHKSG